MNRVGFFLQAYNQAKATAAVLENVRKHYPEEPIFLCSDGGLDFADLAKRFSCEYHFFHENNGSAERPMKSHWAYMNRLALMLAFPIDWIVILEDDVLCRKKIEYWPSMEAAGPIGNEWSPNFKALCKITNRHKVISQYLHYGNCGGSILRRDALEVAMQQVAPTLFDRARQADPRFGQFTDASITGTLQLAGFGYERWLEHSEESCGVFSTVGVGAFDHQWKVHYQ